MMVLILLILMGLSFANCPPALDVSLDLESKTVTQEGKEFRRADLLIFIPVDTKDLVKVSSLRTEFGFDRLGPDLYRVSVRIRNVSFGKVEDAYLLQEGRIVEDSLEGRKVISRLPLIVEPLSLLPTDIGEGGVTVKLPPIGPGEEIEVSYLVPGKKVKVPRVVGGVLKRRKKVYLLVAKYSVLFDFGKVRTEDLNLRNIREVLEGLRRAGLRPVVRIVGVADGRTRDPSKNRRVAEGRARFVAAEVLGTKYACYLRRGLAEGLRDPDPDALLK
jgi:hypothetical protein